MLQGARVVLHGLTGRKDLNGRSGILGGYQPQTGRWAVSVDGSFDIIAIKVANLRVEVIDAVLAADVLTSIAEMMNPADLSAAEAVCTDWRTAMRPRRLQQSVRLRVRIIGAISPRPPTATANAWKLPLVCC